ncbi:MAG TPA: RraA family protein [Caulobacteraceae bacterium]|nr:RraA family protein [Caulobacteraceae bacterium]
MIDLTDELRRELQGFDTPTVCNALEALAPARRGWGYTTEPLFCARPGLPPLVAIARTATIRSAHPNDLEGSAARELSDAYYAYIDAGPKPSVVVIHDMDERRGYGAFWGEVNSAIHKGLGCEGLITNGGVRDLPDIAEGFQMLAARVVPSHAFVHVVDFGRPVDVAGMRVRDGDLIHADQHGAVVIPPGAAPRIRETARLLQARERVIIDAARAPGFNIDKLRAAQGKAAEIH